MYQVDTRVQVLARKLEYSKKKKKKVVVFLQIELKS